MLRYRLSWILRHVTRVLGGAGVLAFLALAPWRGCYTTNLKRFLGNKFPVWKATEELSQLFQILPVNLCTGSRRCQPHQSSSLKRLLKAAWFINSSDRNVSSAEHDSLKVQKHAGPWGKISRLQTPLYLGVINVVNLKRTNSLGHLENTNYAALPMGRMRDIFFPMELRVSRLPRMIAHFPIGINNIRCHKNVKTCISRSDMSSGP